MSTAAKGTLCFCRTSTTPAENPQRGMAGVPFMKRVTLFSWMTFLISSRIGSDMSASMGRCTGGSGIGRAGLDGQGVDRLAGQEILHGGVDHLVLLHQGPPAELLRLHGGLEVIP